LYRGDKTLWRRRLRSEALFDSKPGSYEADRLDILATLIESYEDRHFPIEAPDLARIYLKFAKDTQKT